MVGVAAVFAWAVYRLAGRGLEAIRSGLDAFEWVSLLVLTAAFVYGEGIRALDRRWIPGLVERARQLRAEALVFQVLAPFYGLALVGRDRLTVLKGWLGTFAIVVAVLIIRAMPDPWRGIVDFAVAGALAWGLVALVRRLPSALR